MGDDGAAAMGKVCYIEEVLQSYRRHREECQRYFLSPVFEGRVLHVARGYVLCRSAELLEKFPDHPRREQILAFSQARKKRKDGAAVEIPPDGACRGNV